MDPINPLNSLTELLRKRIAAEASGKRSGLTSSKAKETGKGAQVQRASVEALREQLTRSIQAIDADDPAKSSKTMRVFVESVLAWQFGAAVLPDPRFADLVADVQATLESDPGVSEALSRLVAEMKG